MFNRLKEYLSWPWMSFAFFVAALSGKIGLMRIFLYAGTDKFTFIAMTHNFLYGHGFRLSVSPLTDLGVINYIPDNGWPPVYNLLLSVFMRATPDNYMLATLLVDCVAAVLFFWYSRKLLLLAGFPAWLTNLFLLFQGFVIPDYIEGSSPTDFLSLSLLLAGFYYLLRIVAAARLSIGPILLLSLFWLLASLTRYQYLPVGVAGMGALVAAGWLQRNKHWRSSGLLALTVVCGLYGGFLLYQQLTTGDAYYLQPAAKGVFPSNLLSAAPFVLNGMVNVHFYCVQLANHTAIDYNIWMQYAQWTGIPLAIVFTGSVLAYLWRQKGRIHNTTDGFFVLGAVLFLSSVLLLAYLSVVYSKDVGPPMFSWTYVMNARYFAFPIFFLQACLWWFIFMKRYGSVWVNVLKGIIVLLMAVEIGHGLYFTVKKFTNGLTPIAKIVPKNDEYLMILNFISEQQRKDPSRAIVVSAFSKRDGFLAGVAGYSAMMEPGKLNTILPASSKPAVLLLLMRDAELPLYEAFLRRPGVRFVGRSEYVHAYAYDVEPAQ